MKLARKLLTVLIGLIPLVVGVLFALQNTTPIPLDLLVYTFEPQSIALWILVAFVLGGLLGLIASAAVLVRMRATLGSCRRQLNRTSMELSKLRNEGPVAGAS
jgi:lipopolysaccharide assembly protein A